MLVRLGISELLQVIYHNCFLLATRRSTVAMTSTIEHPNGTTEPFSMAPPLIFLAANKNVRLPSIFLLNIYPKCPFSDLQCQRDIVSTRRERGEGRGRGGGGGEEVMEKETSSCQTALFTVSPTGATRRGNRHKRTPSNIESSIPSRLHARQFFF